MVVISQLAAVKTSTIAQGIRYATADFRVALLKLSMVWVNCASTSSAIIMTSGRSKLKSSTLKFLCNVPKIVT